MTHAVSQLISCCTPLPVNVLPAALTALRNHHHAAPAPDLDVDEVVRLAYLEVIAEHLNHPGFSVRTPSEADETLRTVAALAPADLTVEEAVAAAVSDDLDGELMCWEVITCESIKHIGLIRKEASKLVRRLPETSTDDLLGYGWAGLRAALRQYDPSLGFTFSTYACPKINGMIRDGIRSEHVLPKRLTTLARAVAGAEEALTQQLARTPTYAEILACLQAKPNQVALLPRLVPAASLEELSAGQEQQRDLTCLIDESDPASDAESRVRTAAVREALEELPDLEASVVRMVCLEERTMTEVSTLLGLDIRAVSAAKRRGVEALQVSLAAWKTAAV